MNLRPFNITLSKFQYLLPQQGRNELPTTIQLIFSITGKELKDGDELLTNCTSDWPVLCTRG